MSVDIIRGNILAQLQSEQFLWDSSRGFVHRSNYHGVSQDNMRILQDGYIAAGIASVLDYTQDGCARLDVEDSTQSYLIDTWQILGNEEGRDGLNHPGLTLALTAASLNAPKIIAAARQHLENNDDPTTLFGTGGDFYGSPAILRRFYELQVRGSTEYRHGQYVLRHTTNAPNRYSANISDFGVDQIYTPAELISECSDGGAWVYPLPSRLAYKISNIAVPTYQANYLWGWLKGASTETTAANNRIEISTEFICEQWSTDYNYPY